MIYLTYNDAPSGIYYSQVIDVCKFINAELNCNIRLVALISIRKYWANRRKIKQRLPTAIVIPMVPKPRNWRLNELLLKLVLPSGKHQAICRGIFATQMALDLKRSNKVTKVVFDARGAYKAEFEEFLYKIVDLKDSIEELEKKSLQLSDYRLAISDQLVDYWKKMYGYEGKEHVVIPCTLTIIKRKEEQEKEIAEIKEKFNVLPDDTVLVYAGSNADWQSIDLVDTFFINQLQQNQQLKIILLANFNLKDLQSYTKFPGKIIQTWVTPEKVHDYLSIAHYGILIREYSITNQVASPTKFAEYLSAGLKVIISEKIGDFTNFVLKNDAGIVYKNEVLKLEAVSQSEKRRMKELAYTYFNKNSYIHEYKKIINECANFKTR